MTKTQQIYGGSLYELAKEENLTSELLSELSQVTAIFDETPQYWQFLSTVSIPKRERCRALEEALGGKVQPYLLNFMKMLCENAMMDQFKGCAEEFRRRYNEDHNIVQVCALTAVAMSEAAKQRLQQKLTETLGKTVELQNKVDPGCIGGVLLQLPGRQLDGTVRHRLEALSERLQTAVL